MTIGEFSKKSGLSTKALRLYESKGILFSYTRGENKYRYYSAEQLKIAERIRKFKEYGFTLLEISSLLQVNENLAPEKLQSAIQKRLALIESQSIQLNEQKYQLKEILSSLKSKNKPLKAQQRRAIMGFYGQMLFVITGCDGLEETAKFIQTHYRNAGHNIEVIKWSNDLDAQIMRPAILIIPEADLKNEKVRLLHPDVIVIKNMKDFSVESYENYLNLYSAVGPHVNTVLNADDRASVDFAAQVKVKKGRIFYFSKNRALKDQIKKIGGVMSDGDEVDIYGFNLKPEEIHLKIDKLLNFENEIALISSIGAVMTVGLEQVHLTV